MVILHVILFWEPTPRQFGKTRKGPVTLRNAARCNQHSNKKCFRGCKCVVCKKSVNNTIDSYQRVMTSSWEILTQEEGWLLVYNFPSVDAFSEWVNQEQLMVTGHQDRTVCWLGFYLCCTVAQLEVLLPETNPEFVSSLRHQHDTLCPPAEKENKQVLSISKEEKTRVA